ncbi:MAG TPA: hypothetical protein VJ729_08305 [Nitrososphaeraceae archaeon]|nr:hypothetical protein [Nitrososphaeraceae archaeon]
MNNPNTNTDSDIDVDVDTDTDHYIDADTCNTTRNPNIKNIKTDIDIGTSNTARAPYIKHTSPEVKDVCYFAERVRNVLDVKITHLRKAMQKSDNLLATDMYMIRIQALEWTQGKIQDLMLDNVTTDYPFYDDK